MADEPTPIDEPTPDAPAEDPSAAEQAAPEEPPAPEQPVAEAASEEPAAEEAAAEAASEEPAVEETAPRVKPAIPGADLEVDLVLERDEERGEDEFGRYGEEGEEEPAAEAGDEEEISDEPIRAVIELAADARYRATGKRKTAVARVILKPGTGIYTINGKPLNDFFPRPALQRIIRQPLETVGYEEKMDVVARMHGGGVSAQSGALRHGISKALLEADPNLRGELKRRGFLTRDARAKERKKAGLKKARKRPQFSKR